MSGLGRQVRETQELQKEVAALRDELWRQWEYNHFEHCGVRYPPWPHKGICHWPIPLVLQSEYPRGLKLVLPQQPEESEALR